jgi:hypothetical protein
MNEGFRNVAAAVPFLGMFVSKFFCVFAVFN